MFSCQVFTAHPSYHERMRTSRAEQKQTEMPVILQSFLQYLHLMYLASEKVKVIYLPLTV